MRRLLPPNPFSFPRSTCSAVSPVLGQIRSVSTRRNKAKTVYVQLTKNVPKLGYRGDVISVKSGRMRNTLHPYSMAQYIRPGSNTFLTENKLAIPAGNKYRRLLNLKENAQSESDLQKLLARAWRRIRAQEVGRPRNTAKDEVLAQIQHYRERIMKETKWSQVEKKELRQFLDVQRASWSMLKDTIGSEGVAKAKEQILLKTWRRFTEGMKPHKGTKSKKGAVKEKGLEQEPSTSGSVVQGDVKVVTAGVETPVGANVPVGQTVTH